MSNIFNCIYCNRSLPKLLVSNTCPYCGYELNWGELTPCDRITIENPISNFHALRTNRIDHNLVSKVTEHAFQHSWETFVPEIPNHTDLELIGRGGMGVVYRGIQRLTNRIVAIKVIQMITADSLMRERYVNEVRAFARIQHEGIVTIYEVGECSIGLYFTMEYQSGGTLADRLKEGRLNEREAARIMADAAMAIHAAHRECILHRDIKPSNILISPTGQVKITDFGLAKHANDEQCTQPGIVVGTFAYMSPEQALGESTKISKLSDVYCLGSTLYHLLTGRAPHQRYESNELTFRRILEGPPAPRSIRKQLCPILESIVLKSMASNPADRYESALALAEDLQNWLNHRSTVARPLTSLQKAYRTFRRRKVALAMAILFPGLTAGAMVATQETDPLRKIERSLTLGDSVDLVGPTGLPAWHEWHSGEARLEESEIDRACYFETLSESTLVLVRDPRSTHYRLTAEIRHDSNGFDNGEVGLFLGLIKPQIDGAENVFRYQGIHWSDYYSSVERTNPDFQKRHGIRVDDHLGFQNGKRQNCPTIVVNNLQKFTPQNSPANWRKITIDVSPEGFQVQWPDALASSLGADRVTSQRLESVAHEYQRIRTLIEWTGNEVPGPGWSPRAPLGIYAFRSAVSFRNVTLQIKTPKE